MLRKKIIIPYVFLFLTVVLFSCGFKQGVEQPDNQSYIWFSGNTKGAVAIIDDNPPFEVALSYYIRGDGKKDERPGKTLYEVKPGKHNIIVKKGGETVVNRIILINSGATKEIRIP
jgi:hypothetical protein